MTLYRAIPYYDKATEETYNEVRLPQKEMVHWYRTTPRRETPNYLNQTE